MQTSDAGNFFQTTDSLNAASRKALKSRGNAGAPIRLGAKILAILPDDNPSHDGEKGGLGAVFVAEATGTARRVELESKKTTHTFSGPRAPLTSLALSSPSSRSPRRTENRQQQRVLYAGCWDKAIWSWDVDSGGPLRRFEGAHTDFVKAVQVTRVTLPSSAKGEGKGKDILISAGADGAIVLWDTQTGAVLKRLLLSSAPAAASSSNRAASGLGSGGVEALLVLDEGSVEDAAWDASDDPRNDDDDALRNGESQTLQFLTAGSAPEIRRWIVLLSSLSPPPPRSSSTASPFTHATEDVDTRTEAEAVNGQIIAAHDTSVSALYWDSSTGSLWSASADKSVRCWVPRLAPLQSTKSDAANNTTTKTTAAAPRAIKWTQTEQFAHPDFVRDVAVVHARLQAQTRSFVVTACRDEEVRVWDLGSGEVVHTFSGHFEEVTSVGLVATSTAGGRRVVSGSIDGTVRVWGLDSFGGAGERAGVGVGVGDGVGDPGGEDGDEDKGEERGKKSKSKMTMTEEEEAELEALMLED